MADLKGRFKDIKDKVADKGGEAYGKATDDKSKETEGRAQSLDANIKEKAQNSGDGVKDKFSRKDKKKQEPLTTD